MKITLQKLLSKKDSLVKLLNNDGLPIQVSYRLSKAMDSLNKEFNYYEAARNNKIKELGKEDESGNISINPKDTKSFNKYTNELLKVLAEEVEVSVEDAQISIDDLPKDIKMSPADLSNLVGFLIKENDNVKNN